MAGGRIKYNSINLDFDREWNGFNLLKAANLSKVDGMSGVGQTVFLFDRDFITATKSRLTGKETIQLDEFFEFTKDGTSFLFERDRDLGAFIKFEGKSPDTNDETTGTFTRTNVADSAYYLDRSTNLVTAVDVADTARYPEGKFGDGILVEATQTNIITHPSVFGAPWIATNITVNADSAEVDDPAGANDADKLTASAGNGEVEFETTTAVGSTDAVFSVYLKSDTGTVTGTLIIESDVDGTLATQAISVTPNGNDGNGWERFSVVYESAGSPAGNYDVILRIITNTEIMYAWGACLEVGTDTLFPSSVIGATSTSSITRNAEKLLYSTTNIIDEDQGSVGMWFKPQWIYDKHPTACLFHSGADATNQHLSLVITSSGAWEFKLFRNNSTNAFSLINTASAISQNTWHHVVATWDATASSNMLKLYVDGSLLAQGLSGPITASSVGTNIGVGSFNDGVSPANCIFDEFFILKNVLSLSEVTHIYNLGNGLGIRRNRWTAVELIEGNYSPDETFASRYNMSIRMREVLT